MRTPVSARILKLALSTVLIIGLFPGMGLATGGGEVSPTYDSGSGVGAEDGGDVLEGTETPEPDYSAVERILEEHEGFDFEEANAQAENEAGTLYERDKVLVIYDSAFSAEERSVLAGIDEGVEVEIEPLSTSKEGDETIVSVTLEEGSNVYEAIEEIEKDPTVVFAQPNFFYYSTNEDPIDDNYSDETTGSENTLAAVDTNDPEPQGYLNRVFARDAWEIVRTNNAVTVAVIDTGIRFAHEDLAANIDTVNAYDAYADSLDPFNDLSSTYPDTYRGAANCRTDTLGHGTRVAGVLAGRANNGVGIAGVSYNARILPIHAAPNNSDQLTTAAIVLAYNYLITLKQNGNSSLCVINASYGSYSEFGGDTLQRTRIEQAIANGMITIAAGGNEPPEGVSGTTPHYPSDFDSVVGVTGLTASDTFVSGWSYNSNKDICAPGTNIRTTGISSDSEYTSDYSGTSYATPIVSGVAAMVCARYPGISVENIRQRLISTALDLGVTGHDSYYGHGKVNAYGAVGGTAGTYWGVVRLGGATRYDTMKLIAEYGRASASTAIVVSGDTAAWPDSLAAAGLAGLYNAPILTTAANSLSSQTAATIRNLGVSRVIIVGGTAAVADNVRNQIANIVGSSYVSRIGGVDRYATAELVYTYRSSSTWVHPRGGHVHPYYSASHTWKNGSKKKAALLVTGTDYPDALAAAGLSAYTHFPIFLVPADGHITANTKRLLENGNFDEVIAVGGIRNTAAGGEAAAAVDPADVTGWTYRDGRIAQPGDNWYYSTSGATRYETASEVFYCCYLEGVSITRVCLATGLSSVDARAGTALKHPILLADTGATSAASGTVSTYAPYIRNLLVLGGTGALSDSVVNTVAAAWGTPVIPQTDGSSELSLEDPESLPIGVGYGYPDTEQGEASEVD